MIKIIGLEKTYNGLQAVKNLSLTVPAGTIFGLIGPNGAGKSTVINILTSIIGKTKGTVKIFGLDIENHLTKIKSQIGVIPENLPLFEGLTGKEQLNFIAQVYKIEASIYKYRIEEILEFFELSFAKDRLIESYSQGMKKKLVFASAILHNPKVLFLDEPFENIDPISRKKMKDLLKRMQIKGTTVLITSHALNEVEDFCDEVAILNKGKIVYQSATKDIRNKIKNTITKETYNSLEEIFIDLTTDNKEENKIPSWI